MKRALVIAVVLAAAVGLAVAGLGAGGGDGYRVRAIFDNAVSVIPGEDVKVAGVKVGRIAELDVTRDKRAAIVLSIDDPAFQDFRRDATCTIRPQSLIGEKYVECTPTQPRPQNAAAPGPLRKIPDGEPGAGQRLLPIEQTSSPVDIDLIQNILRRPYAQRFSLILNEFGTALAGRGADLRETIRRANPALRETDRVLAILAKQNRVLADLARDSDQALAPLARNRGKLADFVVQANRTAQATAERRADLERNIELFPGFLRELRPTMDRLGGFAAAAAPGISDLRVAAPDVSRFFQKLGPLSTAANSSFKSLGRAADAGTTAFAAFDPIAKQLREFASTARPVGSDLADVGTSLQKTGGFDDIMRTIFSLTTSINGFDELGHYLRASLLVNTCIGYATLPGGGCSANFAPSKSTAAAAAAGTPAGYTRDPGLVRMDRVLRGEDPAAVLRDSPLEPLATTTPAAAVAKPAPAAAPAATLSAPAASDAGAADPGSSLLDYLFGSDS